MSLKPQKHFLDFKTVRVEQMKNNFIPSVIQSKHEVNLIILQNMFPDLYLCQKLSQVHLGFLFTFFVL